MNAAFAARVLRAATMLRVGVPIFVLLGLVRVFHVWHQEHSRAIVLLVCLVAVLVGLAGFMPWFLRRAVERRGVLDKEG